MSKRRQDIESIKFYIKELEFHPWAMGKPPRDTYQDRNTVRMKSEEGRVDWPGK